MKKIVRILLLCISAHYSNAQNAEEHKKKQSTQNTLSIGMEWYHFYKRNYSFAPFSVWHFSYAHMLHRGLSVSATYSFWRLAKQYDYPPTVFIESAWDISKPKGTKIEMTNFNYIDIQLGYQLPINQKHKFNFSLGPSFLKAQNTYVKDRAYIYRPNGSLHFTSLSTLSIESNYYGAVASVGYQYTFWQEKLNAGVVLRARQYWENVPFHILYGVSIGYNF